MINLEAEHFVLGLGWWLLLMGLLWKWFAVAGVICCIASYTIDLVKRIKSETTCPICCNKGDKNAT